MRVNPSLFNEENILNSFIENSELKNTIANNSKFEKVKSIIESGNDIEVWRSLDASEKDLKKRQLVLTGFLESLKKDRPKVKARRKKIIKQPPFEKGRDQAVVPA